MTRDYINSYTLNDTPRGSTAAARTTDELLDVNIKGRSISFGRAHVKVVASIDNVPSNDKLDKDKDTDTDKDKEKEKENDKEEEDYA